MYTSILAALAVISGLYPHTFQGVGVYGANITSTPISSINMGFSGVEVDFGAVVGGVSRDEEDGYEPETYEVLVTAYSSSPDETDDTPFITASGKLVRDGVMAANFLPFGTKVAIPEFFGDKIFTVEDRMHSRKINNVDIWMTSKGEALEFGITRAKIIVLEKPELLLAEK